MEARKLKALSQGVTLLTGWLVAAEKDAAGIPGPRRQRGHNSRELCRGTFAGLNDLHEGNKKNLPDFREIRFWVKFQK